MVTRDQRETARIILPGTALALCLALTACGSGNVCKRACRKVNSCLAARSDDRVTGGSGTLGISTTDCTVIDSCQDELASCQARCQLDASCDALLGGSAELNSCLTQCSQVKNNVLPPAPDAGLVQLNGNDGGSSCMPSCYGKQCGDDGCGGSCGSCAYGESCSYGTCVSGCTPDCYGKQCGDDGCGGSCGSCAYGESCSYGTCVPTSTSTNNSGALCTQSTSCPGGETCMLMEASATTGMCLGTCSTVGDLCPVTSSGTQLSVCALNAQSSTQSYCAWICELQGQTYACPNSYDYTCQVFDASQPDIKLCMPK